MPSIFDSMRDRRGKLYRTLWDDEILCSIGANVTKTPWHSSESSNSYTFCDSNGETYRNDEDGKCRLLEETFGIGNKKLFEKKFKMAIGGSGSELEKIATMHSSSLCALLHFYNVSVDNPFDLYDDISKKKVRFKESVFEYKSPVIGAPSNMDIVLISDEAVLFLESKFGEYYLDAGRTSSQSISSKYLSNDYANQIYNREFISRLDLEMIASGNEAFKLRARRNPFYIDGIKQMISHYVSVRNLLELSSKGKENVYVNGCEMKRKVMEKINSGAEVILGEILFDYKIGDLELSPKHGCLEAYSEKYAILAAKMTELSADLGRIRVLKEFSKDYPWIIIEGTISFKLSNGYQMSIESSRMGGHGALSIFLSMDCEENDVEEVKDFLLSDYTDPHEIYLAMREWLKKYEEKQQPELSDSYTPNN